MADGILTYRGVVYPWHCDHMGHMNVMWYTGKFDEATWQLLSRIGLTRSYFSRAGTGMAAVEQHTLYKRELHAGDSITIHSRVLEVTAKSVRFSHEMVHDESGEIAATTTLVGVHINTATRKSAELPSNARAQIEKLGQEELDQR